MGQLIMNGVLYGGGVTGVTIHPQQSSGTPVATVIIDGVETQLYAPDPGSQVTYIPDVVSGVKIGTLTIDSSEFDVYSPNPGSVVNFTPSLLSGTKIGSIEIDGVDTDIFAPEGSGGSTVEVTQVQSSGVKVASIAVDGVTTDLYSPNPGSAVSISPLQSSGVKIATVTIDGSDTDIYSPEVPANDAVTQTATDSSPDSYEILFSGTADNLTRTEGARKAASFTYNPDALTLSIGDTNADETLTLSAAGIDVTNTGSNSGNMSITTSDIVNSSTWDGVNSSLKSAVSRCINTDKIITISKSATIASGATEIVTWSAVELTSAGIDPTKLHSDYMYDMMWQSGLSVNPDEWLSPGGYKLNLKVSPGSAGTLDVTFENDLGAQLDFVIRVRCIKII